MDTSKADAEGTPDTAAREESEAAAVVAPLDIAPSVEAREPGASGRVAEDGTAGSFPPDLRVVMTHTLHCIPSGVTQVEGPLHEIWNRFLQVEQCRSGGPYPGLRQKLQTTGGCRIADDICVCVKIGTVPVAAVAVVVVAAIAVVVLAAFV